MSNHHQRTYTSIRIAMMLAGFLLLLSVGASRVLAQGASGVLEEHEGTLDVLHEDRDNGSRFLFFLNKAKERLELRFSGEYPALQSGDQIKVRGRRVGANLWRSTLQLAFRLSHRLIQIPLVRRRPWSF